MIEFPCLPSANPPSSSGETESSSPAIGRRNLQRSRFAVYVRKLIELIAISLLMIIVYEITIMSKMQLALVAREMPGGVEYLALSPDGQSIATVDVNNNITILKMQSLEPIYAIDSRGLSVRALDYRRDSKALAIGGLGGDLMVWTLPSLDLLARVKAPSGVSCLTYSRDGQNLITGGPFQDPTVRIWEASSLKLKSSFKIAENPGGVNVLAVSPDGRLVAVPGDVQGSIALWDVKKEQRVREFGRDDVRVTGLAFSPNGGSLAEVLDDRIIKLWDLDTIVERRLEPAIYGVASVAFSLTGDFLLAAGTKGGTPAKRGPGFISVWDCRSSHKVADCVVEDHPIACMALEGDRFATGSVHGITRLKIWSLKSFLKDHLLRH